MISYYFRELNFKKGDIVYVIKKLNQDWYSGEHHGSRGIFPVNYVQFLSNEVESQYGINELKRRLLAMEGFGKASFDFRPQSNEELELKKV